jgi:hypothetical protein
MQPSPAGSLSERPSEKLCPVCLGRSSVHCASRFVGRVRARERRRRRLWQSLASLQWRSAAGLARSSNDDRIHSPRNERHRWNSDLFSADMVFTCLSARPRGAPRRRPFLCVPGHGSAHRRGPGEARARRSKCFRGAGLVAFRALDQHSRSFGVSRTDSLAGRRRRAARLAEPPMVDNFRLHRAVCADRHQRFFGRISIRLLMCFCGCDSITHSWPL